MPSARESRSDVDYDKQFGGSASGGGGWKETYAGAWRGAGGDPAIRAGTDPDPRCHLARTSESQLHLDIRIQMERMIGLQIIDMLNDAGYVAGDLATLAGNSIRPL